MRGGQDREPPSGGLDGVDPLIRVQLFRIKLVDVLDRCNPGLALLVTTLIECVQFVANETAMVSVPITHDVSRLLVDWPSLKLSGASTYGSGSRLENRTAG